MVAVCVAGPDLIRATGFIVAIVVIAFGRVPHFMNDRIDISRHIFPFMIPPAVMHLDQV
jgi:hypothetical protein